MRERHVQRHQVRFTRKMWCDLGQAATQVNHAEGRSGVVRDAVAYYLQHVLKHNQRPSDDDH